MRIVYFSSLLEGIKLSRRVLREDSECCLVVLFLDSESRFCLKVEEEELVLLEVNEKLKF